MGCLLNTCCRSGLTQCSQRRRGRAKLHVAGQVPQLLALNLPRGHLGGIVGMGDGDGGGVADGRAGSAAAARRTAWTPWAKLPPTVRRPCSAYMRGGAAADPGECVPTCLTSGGAGE